MKVANAKDKGKPVMTGKTPKGSAKKVKVENKAIDKKQSNELISKESQDTPKNVNNSAKKKLSMTKKKSKEPEQPQVEPPYDYEDDSDNENDDFGGRDLVDELSYIKIVFKEDADKAAKEAKEQEAANKKGKLRNKKDGPYEFDIPKDLMCFVCHKLMVDPMQCYKCQGIMCKVCLEKRVKEYKRCPKCSQLIVPNLLKPASMEQQYANTFIECKYKEYGCTEKFNLLEIKNHIATCVFKEMANPDNKAEEDENLDPAETLKRKRANDPVIKSRLLDYLTFSTESFAENIVPVCVTTDGLSEMANKQRANPKGGEFRKEVENIFNTFSDLNIAVDESMTEITKQVYETNSKMKALLMQSKHK